MEASVRPDIPELPLTDSARSSGSAGRKSSASRGRRRKITLDQVEAELCQRLIDSGDKLTKTDEHLAKLLARKLTFPEDNSVGVADRNAHAGDGKLDTDYKLKEAEGLIAILQDELTAAKRAQTEVAEEARHWREETENLKCALRDIRRDNERLTAERDHAICQQYETRKVLEDQRKAEDIG
ncbi:hypothetical protein FOL46_006886 [Perkinsus olseni]|nr:hypothetical protein FOL46_006886 [Perkinsus olseni]